MDFSVIFQLRNKKFWWMDVIFYFAISLLVATVFSYLIFLVKNGMTKNDIKDEILALQTVGTDSQKEQEKVVVNYQQKVNDFVKLFKNHEFASNVFAFMEKQTMPNIWFKQFALDEKNRGVQLSGEADSMDALSRQVATFEKNEYVKSVGALNSSLGESARIEFNFNLSLDPNIFSYIANMSLVAVTPPDVEPEVQTTPAENSNTNSQSPSSEKLISAFYFLQPTQVNGVVDEKAFTVILEVPFGTDITNLMPSIIISSNATVFPESGSQQDFTNPVIYKITAQDGSTQDYTVTVSVLPNTVQKFNKSWAGVIWMTVLLIVAMIGLTFGAFFIYQKKIKSKTQ